MLLDLKSLSNTSLHVKEDFRKGKDGFCLGLNRRHQWWMIQPLTTRPSTQNQKWVKIDITNKKSLLDHYGNHFCGN
jgi:hypothetical protein